jgi:hypothetical protein
MVEGRRQREDAVERHEAERRLEPDDAAARGGDADRPAGVGAERGIGEAGGERGGRAAAGAARRPAGCDRVRDRPVMRVLRGDAIGELVQVRLADVREARRLEPRDGLRRTDRDVVGEDRRAVRRRQPGRVEQILDGERDACGRRRVGPGEKDALYAGAENSR